MKKIADKIRRVGLIANVDKPASRELVKRASALIRATGRSVFADAHTARLGGLKNGTAPDVGALAREVDLLLTFGGDGTMLRVAREVAGIRTPILGINVGSLGFLTGVSARQLDSALKRLWKGEFTIVSCPLIEATTRIEGTTLVQRSLNDFVISRGAASRMIELEVTVDDEELTRYRCDGLIVSSPTGSTAYSLSAGGAIVSPAAEVFTITPICPHTLSNRSVIVSLASTVRVRVLNEKPETILASDGQVETVLNAGTEVTIRRSRRVLRLVKLEGSSFFRTLRQKLNWSGSTV